MPPVAAVLLAAGESARMGRPKPLLPWEGGTLVGWQVGAVADAGAAPIVVVLGHEAPAIAAHVRGSPHLRMVINPVWPQGKTTSIRLGLREAGRDAQGILLLAVDQPVPPVLLRALVTEHVESGALITQPTHQGKGGHPLLFHASLFDELLAITEETQGVRAILERHAAEVHAVPVDSPLVRVDINTPDDYRRAQGMLHQGE